MEFIVEARIDIATIKGTSYDYLYEEAKCVECGLLVFVPELVDSNLESLYDVYRQRNDIISRHDIIDITRKYAIGKRPLSILLGWGELTFSRYCDGDIPTKQYSDVLKRIYNDPRYYLDVLEANKGKLKSISSYKKSKKAVDELLAVDLTATEKIDFAIKLFLNRCEDITPLALQKALYYTQGFNYAFNNNFMFKEDCQAWTHGPVYRDIYLKYKDYRFEPIDKVDTFDDFVFSPTELAVLESVAKNICCYSGKVLETFTHNERPWLELRVDIPDDAKMNIIISKEAIADYFVSVKERHNMLNPNDISLYAKSMFKALC